MKKSRLFALALALILVLGSLTGCGSGVPQESWDESKAEAPMENMEAAEEELGMTPMEEPAPEAEESPEEDPQSYSEKIIYSGSVMLETTKFDEALQKLEATVRSFGGFVQNSSVDGHTVTRADGTTAVVDRWAYYEVRVPADRFGEFLALTGNLGNVTSSGKSAENVTFRYRDNEARLKSLRTQEERLLTMLEESGDLESLLALEARLSEVRYEIESIETTLRDLDHRLAYSTVTLEIREVEVYTPSASAQRTFGQKVSDAFRDGWSGFVRSLQRFTIDLIYALPTLILLAILAAAAAVIVVKARKKLRTRRMEKKAAAAKKQEEET